VPWICVLVISTTMAYAMDSALVGTLREPSPADTGPVAETHADMTWITLQITDVDGNEASVDCLARTHAVSADIISVDADAFATVVSELCSQVWSS
jgi:hypothetical protein